jgi:hypothetical protein
LFFLDLGLIPLTYFWKVNKFLSIYVILCGLQLRP